MKHTLFYTIAIIAIAFLLYLNFGRVKDNFSKNPIIITPEAPQPIGPYSQAVLRGNALFVSGQIAINPATGKMDTTSIQNETKQVMQNIMAILKTAGFEAGHIAKTTIYLTDLKNFSTVNDIYGTYFGSGPFPARETVQVAALPKGAHIEISVTAVK
ncbi:MAG: RidA family protein [Bacteroidia bacterium]